MWTLPILVLALVGGPDDDPALPAARPVAGAPPGATSAPPEPAAVRLAFAALDEEERYDVVEWYRLEMSQRWTVQMSFVRHVIETESAEIDPGTWPSIAPPPYYDPLVHAPEQAIPRRFVDPDSNEARRLRERLFSNVPERELWSGWVYDWGTGELRRLRDGKDVERAFHNALQGFPPDVDLAEALLERWLDDGSERAKLAAFAHAYTDRSGNAYADLTLYDAWASGESFETPDVDVLGLVHDLEDDWKTWVAPISPYRAERLYKVVEEEFFRPAHRHRGLRTALARTYLVGDAVLRDGYAANLERFHALWEFHGASPEALRAVLPKAADWERFLNDWVKTCQRDGELIQAGRDRRWALNGDAREAYKTLVSVLRRAGAL